MNKNNFNFSNSCNNIKKVLCYNDNELNSLDYEKALLNDKRTFMQYYLSLLKIKHLVVFAFYNNNNDYNSQIIKINLFFFFLSVHFTVNALFFNDNTMHKIAEDEGSFNFVCHIPQIILSSIISVLLMLWLNF